jgi:hypothetical protein
VLVAGGANLSIALAKAIVGLISGPAEEADRRLRARFPAISYLFLDPTPR